MDETFISVKNLRIKIPIYIEDSDKQEREEKQEKYNTNLLYFLWDLIDFLCKIRIPRFFTIYKIF
jgi:hypothetical protein